MVNNTLGFKEEKSRDMIKINKLYRGPMNIAIFKLKKILEGTEKENHMSAYLIHAIVKYNKGDIPLEKLCYIFGRFLSNWPNYNGYDYKKTKDAYNRWQKIKEQLETFTFYADYDE